MIKLWEKFWQKFLYDEDAAERWVRGLGNFLAALFASFVFTLPTDIDQALAIVKVWDFKDWAWRVAAASAFFLANARVSSTKPKEEKK